MTTLVSPALATALIKTSLADANLQVVIDREEAEVIRLFGAHYVTAATISETLAGGTRSLYLRRRIGSITSITEYLTSDSTTGALLTAVTGYRLWGGQGRIERQPWGAVWGAIVDIVYTPVDDNDTRKAVIIDLVRLTLERTAMLSESVAGEYSYTAPAWSAARTEILGRLGFVNV